MDTKGKFGLPYAEDFSVACTVNYLKQEEVLQYLINRVSFYAFIGGEMEAVVLWATNIVIDCKEATVGDIVPVNNIKVQKISLKYIKLLTKLSENDQLTTVDKMKESFYLMAEWEAAMGPLVDYPRTIELDDDRFLILTFDFNLLCRMNGVSPDQVLLYFTEKVSLARERAYNLLEIRESDPCMSLFGMILMSRSMQKSRHPVQQEIHRWYADQLSVLDEQLKEENDLKKREQVYRDLYKEWYNTLQKNLN